MVKEGLETQETHPEAETATAVQEAVNVTQVRILTLEPVWNPLHSPVFNQVALAQQQLLRTEQTSNGQVGTKLKPKVHRAQAAMAPGTHAIPDKPQWT